MKCTRDETKWIAVGRVGRAKGLDGGVVLHLYNPCSEILSNIKQFAIGEKNLVLLNVSIREVLKEHSRYIVHFSNFDSRSKIHELVGKELYVDRANLPPLPDGKYYCCDLVGCKIVTTKGKCLGVLQNVMSTLSNDIYVIKDSDEKETLLPIIEGVIKKVDLSDNVIVVEQPEVMDAF